MKKLTIKQIEKIIGNRIEKVTYDDAEDKAFYKGYNTAKEEQRTLLKDL